MTLTLYRSNYLCKNFKRSSHAFILSVVLYRIISISFLEQKQHKALFPKEKKYKCTPQMFLLIRKTFMVNFSLTICRRLVINFQIFTCLKQLFSYFNISLWSVCMECVFMVKYISKQPIF